MRSQTDLRRRALVAAALAPLVLASCGTRLADAELGLGDGGAAVVQSVQDTTAVADGTGTAVAPPTAGAAVPGAVPGAVSGADPGANPAAPGANAGTTQSGASGATTGGGGAKVNTSAGNLANAPCAKTLDPINLGQNGAFSGFMQSSFQGYLPGMAAWAADVNSRGGVQCHPIKLFQVDDGANPARTVSNTKDLIENKKVVAMVAAAVPFNFSSYRSVTGPAGIPTVGGDNTEAGWETDPVMYPIGVTVLPGMALALKALATKTGLKKMGVVYCVEASACAQTNQGAPAVAKAVGLEIVNRQGISLTQTDYTSNCQTAKNAGAELLLTTLDTSALQRFFRSCSAIGYYPPAATLGLAAGPPAVADPNVQKATVTLTSTTAPYFNASLPAVAEYQRVMKKFAPSAAFDSASMSAYGAGRMFEAALARVASEARSGPVTTALILKGLHSIKNERLGGLVASGITYQEGKPHRTADCGFVTVVQTGGLADPLNGKPVCLSAPLGGGSEQATAESPLAATEQRPALAARMEGGSS